MKRDKLVLSYMQLGDKGKGKSKDSPILDTTVGSGADPGFHAVRPQVTSHKPGGKLPYFLPGPRLPSQSKSVTALWSVPNYTAW